MSAMRTYRICLHDARHQHTILEIVRRHAAMEDVANRRDRAIPLPQRAGAFA
jgi:hypothetical protein